tara:strand:- start:7623 stop:7820 length:198 start_codon:yes stop_codon:yes gene_type:complete
MKNYKDLIGLEYIDKFGLTNKVIDVLTTTNSKGEQIGEKTLAVEYDFLGICKKIKYGVSHLEVLK